MTPAGQRFVSPLTFHALTGRPVYTDMWDAPGEGLPTHIAHVGLAHAADLMVIAPATANTLAKLAAGLADNLLSTLALAARCPLLVAPAMDVGMWANAATKANASILGERGVLFAGPAWGRMASGLEGEGRLVEPEILLGHVRRALGRDGRLVGRTVVVTAGPTRESLDPARFLSNPSTGRQGYALAQAAIDRGAKTVLVSGPTSLVTPVGAELVPVMTASEMLRAVTESATHADALLMAAAVADYAPAEPAAQKMKKTGKGIVLTLAPTADILLSVSERRAATGFPRLVVGFAAETADLFENAVRKLEAKGLDLIAANDITAPDAGFSVETNRVTIIGRGGDTQTLPLQTKAAVAEAILDQVECMLAAQS
jgi:phosphopantothenoylcysteine decarboxylase/phosphopantothenate--cysteine ligase